MSKCLAILCQKIHSTFFSEENQSRISTLCILCQLCLAFALQLNVNYNCDVFISTIFDSDISFTVHVFPSIANLQVFNSIHHNIRILNHCSIIRFCTKEASYTTSASKVFIGLQNISLSLSLVPGVLFFLSRKLSSL